MSPARWGQVRQLLYDALQRQPSERTEYLKRECGNDSVLMDEVKSFIDSAESDDRALLSSTLTALHLVPGIRLGQFEIVSLIGAGGMGMVYRAHDTRLGRDVALKTLPLELACSPGHMARFRREAQTLAALDHPNIAAVYGLEEFDGAAWIVMELIEGETLGGQLPIQKALNFARQVAEALEAAHEKGIVHRDLKPSNVRVTPQGRVKVLDFGLAKAVGVEDGGCPPHLSAGSGGVETMAGQVLGTPSYMSPEQARGQRIDQRSDIWAFGCLLFELLAGKRAFRGENTAEIISAVLQSEPDWRALPSGISAAIKELLHSCLNKDPNRRLRSIDKARSSIEAAISGPWRRWRAATAAVALAAALMAPAFWPRGHPSPADRSQWVRITDFPDSVSQPALSSDGRMLTFVRGSDTFAAPGQIYVKMLPAGEAAQLTHDDLLKMSPVFSPDGTRIAYTAAEGKDWNTWLVSPLNGQPHRWLSNASGLVWSGKNTILFSERQDNLVHM